MDIEFVRSRFIKHFDGKTGNIYQSPGRINLIGEHTDYNGGFVFPGAVSSHSIWRKADWYSITMECVWHVTVASQTTTGTTWQWL